jgi:hypothetical protein
VGQPESKVKETQLGDPLLPSVDQADRRRVMQPLANVIILLWVIIANLDYL